MIDDLEKLTVDYIGGKLKDSIKKLRASLELMEAKADEYISTNPEDEEIRKKWKYIKEKAKSYREIADKQSVLADEICTHLANRDLGKLSKVVSRFREYSELIKTDAELIQTELLTNSPISDILDKKLIH